MQIVLEPEGSRREVGGKQKERRREDLNILHIYPEGSMRKSGGKSEGDRREVGGKTEGRRREEKGIPEGRSRFIAYTYGGKFK